MTREELRDYVEKQRSLNNIPYHVYSTLIDGIDTLEQEPRKGHWITTRTFMHDGEFYCDRCKCEAPKNGKWDYCPNCGADMRGEE